MTTDTYEVLKEEYIRAANMSCKPDASFRKVRTGEVIDEDKSVKWNREEVEKLQKEYQEEVKKLNSKKNAAINDIFHRAVILIAEDTGLSEEKAKILWDFVYSRYHEYGEMFDIIDEYVDLVCNLMRQSKKGKK